MKIHKQGHKRSPAKYGARAKLITSAAALLALLGGCTAIGRWEDTAQAGAASPDTAVAARVQSQVSQELLTLETLGIAPLATLPPVPASLAQAVAQPAAAGGLTALPLPDLPQLQALPSLQPLPELPPPPPSSGTGNVSGGS